MTSPVALLATFFFFGFNSPQIGEGCIATSSTGDDTTTPIRPTTTTTVAARSCATCLQNLMQVPRTSVPNGIDGVAVITYSIQGGCIVPNIVCNAVDKLPYNMTIALQENEGLLFGGGCATTAMPPGIVVCNAMGQWISTVTNNIQPQIVCAEANPATSPTC